ncbi:hypothetical protein GCM10010980_02040 [Corynebacterium marinum]|nr:hypothetical protein GCM10010980_02040 [Corynebacterium marinum]
MSMDIPSIRGRMSIIGLAPAPPSIIRPTIAAMPATMTTGMSIRSIGTGAGRFAAGTGSAFNVPCGNGGAGSRSAGVIGSTTAPTVSLTPSNDIDDPPS